MEQNNDLEPKAETRGRKQKATGVIPDGWGIYEVVRLEKIGFEKGVAKFADAKVLKTVKISDEQADELNAHKHNTLKEYRLKK